MVPHTGLLTADDPGTVEVTSQPGGAANLLLRMCVSRPLPQPNPVLTCALLKAVTHSNCRWQVHFGPDGASKCIHLSEQPHLDRGVSLGRAASGFINPFTPAQPHPEHWTWEGANQGGLVKEEGQGIHLRGQMNMGANQGSQVKERGRKPISGGRFSWGSQALRKEKCNSFCFKKGGRLNSKTNIQSHIGTHNHIHAQLCAITHGHML